MNIDKITLQGRRVRLEPLAAGHLPGLGRAIEDGRLWELAVTSVPGLPDLPAYLQDAEAAFRVGRELTFATIDHASSTVVGCTRFRNIEPAHRRVEIGSTFVAASWQRSHINTEAKLLMLVHAFEVWGCNRVELLTDELNTRSRAAIRRIGAREEGILRSHMIRRDGHVRNSVIHALIAAEWASAKAALQARLDGPQG